MKVLPRGRIFLRLDNCCFRGPPDLAIFRPRKFREVIRKIRAIGNAVLLKAKLKCIARRTNPPLQGVNPCKSLSGKRTETSVFRYLDLISYDGSTELLVGDEFKRNHLRIGFALVLTERVETECPCNFVFLGGPEHPPAVEKEPLVARM